MKKEEKLKDLLKNYFGGKLTHTEKENLFYLINDEQLKEITISELYKHWESEPENIKSVAQEKIFGNIKQSLQMDEDKSRKDDLILKGIEYSRIKSSRKYLNIFIKYAAVVVFAVLITFFMNYLREKAKPEEIALNEIVVPQGSKIKILLSDSSEVWLNSGSKIIYADNFSTSDREIYLEGEAFFNVRKNKSRPFYIKTSDLSIKVLGTSLNVKAYPDEDLIETTLITGRVEVNEISPKEKNMLTAFLLPEQKASYNKETGIMRIEQKKDTYKKDLKTLKTDDFIGRSEQITQVDNPDIAWKDNKLVFNNEALGSLARRLERWYNVEIEVMDEDLNNSRFTGILENETAEQVMYALRIASSMDYKFEKNKITIWKSNN